ncbi:MAG: hypothetical protein Alpg2KO_06800 [Alphaproteobacteria bacterium]
MLKKIGSQRRGVSLSSYGLVVGLVAIVALTAISSIGSSVDQNFQRVGTVIEGAITGEAGDSASSPEATPAQSPIFSFTSHTFTSCGQTARSGPSEANCESSYSSTSWASDDAIFNVVSGVQTFVIPATGTYSIEAAGAEGGEPNNPNSGRTAGAGRIIEADFDLTVGTTVSIVVGQRGALNSSGNWANGGGGGGGGSFVFIGGDTQPLVAAGGGGGLSIHNVSGGNTSGNTDGRDGNTGEAGLPARNLDPVHGTGGASASDDGGKGWNEMRTGGFDGINGKGYGQQGGFGGGGGARDSAYHAGGGGGGYSGGGGGNYANNTGNGNADGRNGGGGGGSYVGSAGTLTSSSGTNTGQGFVTLTLQ